MRVAQQTTIGVHDATPEEFQELVVQTSMFLGKPTDEEICDKNRATVLRQVRWSAPDGTSTIAFHMQREATNGN